MKTRFFTLLLVFYSDILDLIILNYQIVISLPDKRFFPFDKI